MIKRHAETIKDEDWFYKKPWLIAGTGPSLSKYSAHNLQYQFNILSIYYANDVLESDLYLCLDEGGFEPLVRQKYRYAVARLDSKIKYPENTLYIAVHTNETFPGYENYPSQPSSSHALTLLNRCGIRLASLVGIDGGIGATCEGINEIYRNYSNKLNFDDENTIMFKRAEELGMELVKL